MKIRESVKRTRKALAETENLGIATFQGLQAPVEMGHFFHIESGIMGSYTIQVNKDFAKQALAAIKKIVDGLKFKSKKAGVEIDLGSVGPKGTQPITIQIDNSGENLSFARFWEAYLHRPITDALNKLVARGESKNIQDRMQALLMGEAKAKKK
jgi:hypothetical protein